MTTIANHRVSRPARMRRLIPPFVPIAVAAKRPGLLRLGIWLGIATGLGEMSALAIARWATGKVTVATLTTNHHYAWMIPLCDLALLGGVGLLLALIVRLVDRPMVSRVCTLVMCLLAAYAMALALPKIHKLATLALTLGAGWRMASWIEAHPEAARRLVSRSLPAFGATFIVLIAVGPWMIAGAEGRALATLPDPVPGSPNVLLIVLDTVRADAMSPNRLDRETTPNLAKLAARGVRFEQARSTAPWTLPAHASLFTGRWPHEHSANVGRPLDDTHPTVAEVLSDRGYATAAFMANTHNGNAWYGLDRGFAHYEDLYENRAISAVEVLRSSGLGRKVLRSRTGRHLLGAVSEIPSRGYRKTGAMINRDLLAWLPTRGDRPFFAFLNYYDVHDPYEPPEGVDRTFAQAVEGKSRSVMEVARADYDDCLRSLDDQIGRLLDDLEGRGVMDNTLVIVTSDHGEGFGEHGLQGHGISLYRPELHVPLLVVFPSRVPAGRTVLQPVSTRDIADTILDLVPRDTDFPGNSLARFWTGPPNAAVIQDEPVLATVERSAKVSPLLTNAPARLGPMFSLILDGLKLIRNGDGREELYDLANDPEETRDLARLASSEPDLVRLREQLARLTDDQECPECD